MEITNATKPVNIALSQSGQKTSLSGTAAEAVYKPENGKEYQVTQVKQVNEPDSETVEKLNEELNKFMQTLNANIRFTMHERTQRLIVQVVDIKENRVLKEFPPHELLDTIANIREYVGILLDKKA